MDEQQTKRGGLGRLLWLFVILAILVLWWYFRPDAATRTAQLQEPIDAIAAAATDPDDILVDLKDDATPDAIEQALGIQLTLVDESGVASATKLYRAHVDPAQRDALVAQLSARPDVEIAEPDAEMALSPFEMEQEAVATPVEPTHDGFPNDPLYVKQWHLRQIGMPEAWKLAQGNGVVVAVLDTGVSYEDYGKFHQLPDLKGVQFVKPYDFVKNTTHAGDDHGHGSHVTGTIAQATNNGIGVAGVALDVKIMPLKVLSASGSGSVGGIADAIRYAADNGAKVINMSLGGAFPSKVLKKAVEYAHGKGVTVVCAAGNESRGKVGYPAAYPGAIAVAATQDDEATTFYSNWGKEVDIAAPGGNTRDANGGRNNPDGGVLQNTIEIGNPAKDGYFAFMGTSMASPHVAGVAALVVGEGITNPDQVEKILKETARKPKNQKYDAEHYGAGIMDAPAAIKKARAKLAESDTSSDGWSLALGLGLAGAVAAGARRRRGLGVKLGWTYLAGVVVGASGLFFLPWIAPGVASLPVIHTLTHGVPAWVAASTTGSAVFLSALIPLVLLAVGYGFPRLRAPIAGLAVGIAAHLAFFAVAPLATAGAVGFGALWLGLNALACLVLARIALRR
jgi:serine protease